MLNFWYVTPLINKGIQKFIYDVRCSFMRNKESDFQISYANYGECETLVPVIKDGDKGCCRENDGVVYLIFFL